MARSAQTRAELVVVGTNHRTGTAALRDRLFVEEAAQPLMLADLRAAGIEQALVLSTCDRSEVQAAHADAAQAAERINEILARQAGVAPALLSGQSYRLTDDDALRHVFAVAASLDSQTIGEPQILGQLRASHRIAQDAGMIGSELETVLQAAYHAAKRVRRETALAEQPVSIATVAVQLARKVHGDLARCGGLLIGTGEMGELIADHLGKAGLGRLTIVHPSLRRAELTARRIGCHFLALDQLPDGLEAADIVVGALGTGSPAVTAAAMRSALKARRQKPVLLLDGALPGDIDPAVGTLEEAFLYDLDDLEKLAMQGRSTRVAAADGAWAIVNEEVSAFLRRQAERAGVPALIALRHHFEAVRAEVLKTTGPGDAERATQLLINKLLHDPAAMLRAIAAPEQCSDGQRGEPAVASAELLRTLFGLTNAAGEGRPNGSRRADRHDEEDEV